MREKIALWGFAKEARERWHDDYPKLPVVSEPTKARVLILPPAALAELPEAEDRPRLVLWLSNGEAAADYDDVGCAVVLEEDQPEDRASLGRIVADPRVLDWRDRVEEVPAWWFEWIGCSPAEVPIGRLPFDRLHRAELEGSPECQVEAYRCLIRRAGWLQLSRWATAAAGASPVAEVITLPRREPVISEGGQEVELRLVAVGGQRADGAPSEADDGSTEITLELWAWLRDPAGPRTQQGSPRLFPFRGPFDGEWDWEVRDDETSPALPFALVFFTNDGAEALAERVTETGRLRLLDEDLADLEAQGATRATLRLLPTGEEQWR
ncbi:MAG: hypothetical protein HUU35_05705 [Armatimonadetes bacterium]|nr:hypothetical protein [Armatimonadota bacterium]